MLADTLPRGDLRRRPSYVRAALQLLATAAGGLALTWLSRRFAYAALDEGGFNGFVPFSLLLLFEFGASALAALPALLLAAVWLRDFAGAPVPQALPALWRRVAPAWGFLAAAFVATLLLLALAVPLFALPPVFDLDEAAALAALDPFGPFMQIVAAQGLVLVLLWTAVLPAVLGRLTAQPSGALGYRSVGRWLACLALFLGVGLADFGHRLLWIDAKLAIVTPTVRPWPLLGLWLAEELVFALFAALALLAAWRLLRPRV
jgi:hypothetical protein